MKKTITKKYKYGSIIFLRGKRLEPWSARITIGYNENGYPIYHFLGFFKEEIDAHLCLREYNNKPYNLYIEVNKYNSIIKQTKIPSKLIVKSKRDIIDKTNYTFKQVYDEFEKRYIPTREERRKMRKDHSKVKGKLGCSNSTGLIAANKQFKEIWNERYSSLKKSDFQKIIDRTIGGKTKLVDMRNLICKLDDFALEEDIISKGYGHLLTIEYEKIKHEKIPFTHEEIQKIWKYEGNLIADILLILLYSGMRIEELLIMKNVNIHLKDDYIIGGLKTANGIDRIIPIHSTVKHIFERYYNTENEFLFTLPNNNRLYYDKYRKMFIEFMEELGFEHTTHETRHTVESEFNRLSDIKQVNRKSVDLIIGHSNGNTGDKVYTKKSIEELKATIELLTYDNTNKITYIRVLA